VLCAVAAVAAEPLKSAQAGWRGETTPSRRAGPGRRGRWLANRRPERVLAVVLTFLD
jgi:hypothetical protein